MERILKAMDWFFHMLSAIGFGLVSVTVLIQIIARYIPAISAPWTDEMSRMFYLYTVMLGCPMAVRFREYASIDVIAVNCKGSWRMLLNIFTDLVMIVVCGIALPHAKTFFVAGMRSLSTSLQINLGIFYVIPLGIFILTILYCFIDVLMELKKKGGNEAW